MAISPMHTGRVDEATRRRLLERYADERRPVDLDRLVRSYRPLALSLARRYSPAQRPDPDLEQAACEGLVKAVKRYDPARGRAFTSFAVPTILGELRRYLRDTSWTAHVPRGRKESVRELTLARDRLATRAGRSAAVPELAQALGWTEEEVVDTLSASAAKGSMPLDAKVAPDDEAAVIDRLGRVDARFELVDCADAVASAAPRLTPEEREVLGLRFGGDLTQRQIALRLGYSRSHVGRLIQSGIDRLRAEAA